MRLTNCNSTELQTTHIAQWTWKLGESHPTFEPNSIAALLGIKEKRVSSGNNSKIIHPDDLARFENVLMRTYRSKGKIPIHLKMRFVMDNGSVKWLECLGNMSESGAGEKGIQTFQGFVFEVNPWAQYEEVFNAGLQFASTAYVFFRFIHPASSEELEILSATLPHISGCYGPLRGEEFKQKFPALFKTHPRFLDFCHRSVFETREVLQIGDIECNDSIHTIAAHPIDRKGVLVFFKDITKQKHEFSKLQSKNDQMRLELKMLKRQMQEEISQLRITLTTAQEQARFIHKNYSYGMDHQANTRLNQMIETLNGSLQQE